MLLERLEDDLEVHRLTNEADAHAVRDRFVDAYRRVFREEPYFEDFSEEEAASIFDRLIAMSGVIFLVVTTHDGHVAAFAVAVPLEHFPEEARVLSGIVPLKHTIYLAELGVVEDYRRRHLARQLTMARLKLIDNNRYSHVVLRVADGRTSSFELYQSLHFKDTGVSITVERRRTDGEVRSDERFFLSRVLSRVPVDRSA